MLIRFDIDRSIANTAGVVPLLVMMSLMTIVLYAYTYTITPALAAQKENITLTALFNQLSNDGQTGKVLIQHALNQLKAVHPNLDLRLKYTEYPYSQTRAQLLKILTNQTTTTGATSEVDLISLDQIWLGEFAKKGLLTDLTTYTNKWGRSSDWYDENWQGGTYNGKVYGIWAWTDVRGIWYWKDLLSKAGVDPSQLKTWNGYIAAAKKLNAALRPEGIEGIHLTGASHSPDLWYPYLWMLGGDVVEQKSGHPTKGSYWFPVYNSSEGIKALEFIKAQVIAGIKPQKNHFWGKEFADRKFAVMIEGSWIPTEFRNKLVLESKVGFIPMFPVPYENNRTSTLMGGWELSIPRTSAHKELAWELITLMLKTQVLGPWLQQTGFLPTEIPISKGYVSNANATSSLPYYDQMISLIPFGGSRPSIPEYPQIAENIKEAIDDVYYGIKEPKQALNDAAAKSAEVLGW
jgi:multiple sugar transport system substrate-binding protein